MGEDVAVIYEYNTIEDAMYAIDVAVEDTLKDQPHLKEYEDDVYHDMVQAIMPDCTLSIQYELECRTGVPRP